MTTGAETIAAATTVTTVTTGHRVTCAPSRAVLRVTMIVTTDAIKAVDAIKIAGETTIVDAIIAGETTIVDATKATGVAAAGVTVAGIAAVTATPTPWTRTNPDPAQGTGMTTLHGGLTHVPTNPSAPRGVTMSTQLTTATLMMSTLQRRHALRRQ